MRPDSTRSLATHPLIVKVTRLSSSDWTPAWGTLLASLWIVAAYPPWDLRHLAWIALVPWLIALSRCQTRKQAFAQGLWLSLGMSVLGFHWVAYVLHQFGMLPWPVAALGLLLYSLVGQPQFLIFGPVSFVAKKLRPKKALGTVGWSLMLALAYTGLDWVLPKLFKDTLGHAFYSAPWLRQSAELGGPHLITFVAFLVNIALFLILESLWPLLRKTSHAEPILKIRLLKTIPVSALAGLLVLAMTLYGRQRLAQINDLIEHPSSTLQAAVIQANIGDFDKLAAENGLRGAAERVLSSYFALTAQALTLQPKPDFVIWPETAYPSTFRKPLSTDDYARDRRIGELVKSSGVPLLFGSYDRDAGKDFNAFFALSPSPIPSEHLDPEHSASDDLQFYHKNILLMFGEYVPFQEQVPFFSTLFPQVANFGRGIGPDVLKIPLLTHKTPTLFQFDGPNPVVATPLSITRLIKMSPLICYEVLFPQYVIDAANKGAQLIINVTNDSWFGPYGEPHLHLALSTFRSIETRLPIVRATNTGFSALILPNGEITQRTHLFEPEILNVTVPLIDVPDTLIKTWGDWFGRFSLILGLSSLAVLWAVAQRQRKI